MTVVHHLRLYNSTALDMQIAANAQSPCLSPVGSLAGSPLQVWGQFDVPTFCNNTGAAATAIPISDRGSMLVTDNPNQSGSVPLFMYPDVTNNFTVEFWVKPTKTIQVDSLNDYAGLFTGIDQHPPYVMFPQHGGDESLGVAGMGIAVGTDGVGVYEHAEDYIPEILFYRGSISGWTHIAIVYVDRRPSLYINGNYVMSGRQSIKTPSIRVRTLPADGMDS
jgi:hypothetical protein